MKARGAGRDIAIGDLHRLAEGGLATGPRNRNAHMQVTSHLERGAVRSGTTAPQHDAVRVKRQRAGAAIDARFEEDGATESLRWFHPRDGVDGLLNRCGVVPAGGTHRRRDRHGWKGNAAAQVSCGGEIHDPITRVEGFVGQFAVGIIIDPLTGGGMGTSGGLRCGGFERECDRQEGCD